MSVATHVNFNQTSMIHIHLTLVSLWISIPTANFELSVPLDRYYLPF